jgi:hypothetical protein
MVLDPRRAEENFATDLAKIRATTRMRLGIVVGVVIVGLLQTRFDVPPDAGLLGYVQSYFTAAKLILGVAVLGVVIILLVARRDTTRARDRYDGSRFHFRVSKPRK